MKQLLIATVLFLLASVGAQAQVVSFTAQAPRQVAAGQRFYLTFTVNREGTGFISPEIQHFDVLSGPGTQVSYQTQFINGKVSRSEIYSYVFILLANEPGSFNIAPATITIEGKKYQSNPVTINVLGQRPSPSAPGAAQQPGQQQKGARQGTAADDPGDEIFLKASVSKQSPYLGEQVILTVKLYTPTSRLSIVPTRLPSYEGFWPQDLQADITQYPQYNETVNGKTYRVAEVRKVALIPQKTGALTIAPAEQLVEYQVRVKGRSPFGDDPFFNDPFFKDFFDNSGFGDQVQTVQKSLKSNALTLNVKALPAARKPLDFSGAVGSFSFKGNFSKNELSVNDALNLRLTVTGSGNLNLLEKPAVNFPPDFEVYDPKILDHLQYRTSGISGSRTFEYLIIPRTAGDFTLSPVTFSYFDPGKNAYVTLSTEQETVRVNKGSGPSASDAGSGRDVKYISNDIRYIKEGSLNLTPTGFTFYGSTPFWLLLILPVILFIVFILLLRKHVKTKADVTGLRRRKATAIASRRLRKALVLMQKQQDAGFFSEISVALWGYISDKFSIPLSSLSMETTKSELEQRNVSSEITGQFISLLHDCEFARFAPGEKSSNMQRLYEEAMRVITDTESQLK